MKLLVDAWNDLAAPPENYECLAIANLLELRNSRVRERLITLSRDQRPLVKLAALSGLARRRSINDEGIRFLESKLQGDPNDVVLAASGLAHFGNLKGVARLREIVDEQMNVYPVYYVALETLVDTKDEITVRKALAKMQDAELPNESQLEAAALVRRDSNPAMLGMLQETFVAPQNAEVLRAVALRGLVRGRSGIAFDLCRHWTSNASQRLIRREAIHGIAELGGIDSMSFLGDLLNGEEYIPDRMHFSGAILHIAEREMGLEKVDELLASKQ